MNRVSPTFMPVRLRNQRLAGTRFRTAAEVVGWFGAVQAQDYGAAKWALALRTKGAGETDVERACASGAIVRTHVLRPTWHFVLPEDLRWMLALTAPRIKRAMAYYDRKLGLDGRTVARSNDAMAKALSGGRQLTRAELAAVVDEGDGQRMGHLLMHAELDAVICSGPRRAKQLTHALVTERCPPAPSIQRDEALQRLAVRYFQSHGPARLHDFAWWSGLTLAEARRAVEIARLGSRGDFWSVSWTPARPSGPVVHLLPSFDEFLVAYKERRELSPTVLLNGKAIGNWRRTLAKDCVAVETRLSVNLDGAGKRALKAAIDRFATYLGLSAVADW